MYIHMITYKRKQNIHSRKEEASLLFLCQKWPVQGTAPLYWLLSRLPVNWKIANIPGYCVLSFWAEQSCCGACLLYLWLHGIPTVLWEMQGLGKETFEELLGRVTWSISLCSGSQHLGTWPCTTSTFICQSPYILFHLPLLPQIYSGTYRSSASGPCWGYGTPRGPTKICGKMSFRSFPADLASEEDENQSAGGPGFVILKLGSGLDNSTLSTRLLRGLNQWDLLSSLQFNELMKVLAKNTG